VSFTVDASVCARWLVPGEEYETQAVRLRDDYAEGRVELYAPSLLVFEVLNVLWKIVNGGMMRAEDAVVLCEAFVKVAPRVASLDLEDLKNALEAAMTKHVSFYDASYIATALKTKSTLVTADKNLFEVAKGYIKTIHLKDY